MDAWIWYNTSVLGALGVMSIVLLSNMAAFRRARPGPAGTKPPFVSVLLPARNEEAVLDRCCASLAAQDYPRYEVLVLDDGSDDGTGAIAARWAEKDPRFRHLDGKTLPEGWVGKAHACHQLAAAAAGDHLLFTDADTIHGPASIRTGVHTLHETRADLLSLIPHQIMKGFWENVVLPQLHFVTMCLLPYALVTATRSPRLAMANGQYMLFRRGVYDEIGGHAAVRAALVEDVWLSRRVKAAGRRLVVLDGTGAVSCRMYTSLAGIWEGFSKNLFPGFRYSLPAMLGAMTMLLATSVAPFLFFLAGPAPGAAGSLIAAQAALVLAQRAVLAVRFRMAWWSVPLHPLGIGMVVAIALNSSRAILLGGGAAWKGRRYNFRYHEHSGRDR